MRKIAFIINPTSGTKDKEHLAEKISEHLGHTFDTPEIVFTQYKGHARELATHYATNDYYAVVACGGDGTVNEVASALIHTETALGILPMGSGNGLARHLGISMNTVKAIEQINTTSEPVEIDYGRANGRPFFCTCGVGFDALVGFECAAETNRGLGMYVDKIVKGYYKYRPEKYHLRAEGVNIDTEALVITFANANQWGNNAYIAPKASVRDGQLDITIMSKFPMVAAASVALHLFTKTIMDDMFVDTLRTQEVTLHRDKPGVFHYDGEPIEESDTIHIKIEEKGLRVIGSKFPK